MAVGELSGEVQLNPAGFCEGQQSRIDTMPTASPDAVGPRPVQFAALIGTLLPSLSGAARIAIRGKMKKAGLKQGIVKTAIDS